MLAWVDAAPVSDFSDVDPVAKQVGQRAAGEWDPANSMPGGEPAHPGLDASAPQVLHQEVEAAEIEIALEDEPDLLGLLLHYDELAIPHLVSERDGATHPHPLLLGGGDLVSDPLACDLPLELREREQDVESQPPHRGGGVEALRHRHERDLVPVKKLDELRKVGQRPGEPIHFVDHNSVDLPGSDLLEEPLQSGAVHCPAREAPVVVAGGAQSPALLRLASDVSLTRTPAAPRAS